MDYRFYGLPTSGYQCCAMETGIGLAEEMHLNLLLNPLHWKFDCQYMTSEFLKGINHPQVCKMKGSSIIETASGLGFDFKFTKVKGSVCLANLPSVDLSMDVSRKKHDLIWYET